jgi:hypothetical protein
VGAAGAGEGVREFYHEEREGREGDERKRIREDFKHE